MAGFQAIFGAAALAALLAAPASAAEPARCPDGTAPLQAERLESCPPVKPPEGTAPRETLSERLDRTDGVIAPPQGIDPGIRAPAPDPNPGTTPVIPPPGTPGGDMTKNPT